MVEWRIKLHHEMNVFETNFVCFASQNITDYSKSFWKILPSFWILIPCDFKIISVCVWSSIILTFSKMHHRVTNFTPYKLRYCSICWFHNLWVCHPLGSFLVALLLVKIMTGKSTLMGSAAHFIWFSLWMCFF